MPKTIYYNVTDNLEYENSLLQKWGVQGLELVEIKDKEGRFLELCQDADGLVVEYEQLTPEKLKALPKLKAVSLQSIGYNNVDLPAATAQGVRVTNVPGFCAEEVALHTVGLLIDLVRKITFLDRSVRRGQWDPLLGPTPHRIDGKSIGLVFFGNIPKTMLPLLQALRLRVCAYAPTKSREYLAAYGVEKVETLDELLEQSDFVSLHTPLLPQTRHLISTPQLQKMKPTAFLLNTARGAVVDEAALVQALREGWIAGAGVDVIEDEKDAQSELFALENVVITPHAAFVSEESFYDAREKALRQQVECLVEGKRPTFLVNRDVQG